MLLGEEHQLLQSTLRAFARERLAPHAAEWDRTSTFPSEALRELAGLGLFGVTIPQEWGGAGLDSLALSIALEEIAAGDGATSTIISVTNTVAGAVLGAASGTQKEEWLRPLAEGRHLGAFVLTEPHAGSDASAIRTQAVRDGDDYVLDGTKQFITSGQNADVAVVFAVTNPDAGSRGISAFLVPVKTPGYTVVRLESKLGQRSSDTAALAFEACRVPAANRLGDEGAGYRIALSNLEGGRIGIASQAIGMARAALEAAVAYAKGRETFGRPIVEHQAVNFRLADMATRIEAARQLTWHAAVVRDSGAPALAAASMAKLFATEMAESVCSDAIQVHGGVGYTSDFPVERLYRDVRVCQIYEGTSDIQKIVIGRSL